MRMGLSTLLRRSWIGLSGALMLPGNAAAGWGDENWGTMEWGESLSVPGLGLLGMLVLAMGIAITAAWTLRKRRPGLMLPLLLVLLAVPLVVAAETLSVPNVFVNGTVADADQVNENFNNVETAVNDNDTRITGAQAQADTAVANAASAQTTADSAQAAASAAQSTANTAQTNAAAAQAAASAAQSTANTAQTNAAAAQATADSAQSDANANAAAIANTVPLYQVNRACIGSTGGDLTLEAQCNALLCSFPPAPLLWYQCDTTWCGYINAQVCDNPVRGHLLSP